MIYEFKTYMATEGNFAALKKRFAEKTIPIFSRLGIEVTHCWDNLENADTFNYLVRFSSKEAEKAAWDAFAKFSASMSFSLSFSRSAANSASCCVRIRSRGKVRKSA